MASKESYLNSTGYIFTHLPAPSEIETQLRENFSNFDISGTILISEEGININLAGLEAQVKAAEDSIISFQPFEDIFFKHSYSDILPFRKLVIKTRDEIIAMKQGMPTISTLNNYIKPKDLEKKIMDGEDLYLLDVRNNYEINIGKFEGSKNLDIMSFHEFPDKVKSILNTKKSIVMYCTGGIRCEKASAHMYDLGFENVVQLQGGILNYFQETNATGWVGDCFVFDDRITVNKNLEPTYKDLCPKCQRIINKFNKSKCKSCSPDERLPN